MRKAKEAGAARRKPGRRCLAAYVSFGPVATVFRAMSAFRLLPTSLLRFFRFGCCGLLTGVVVASCASQSIDRSLYKNRMLRVSGHVLNAVSRQPLAGILIAKNGTQTTSAKDGFFRLKYPMAKKKAYPFVEEDEIAVDLPGYGGRAHIPADTTQLITLPLLPNSYRFPPDGDLRPADSVHVAPCNAPWDGIPGSSWAFLIQDSSIHQPRRLRAITFRIGQNGFVREPFRVRLHRYNGPAQPPGEDLLTEIYLIDPRTEGVFSYDLSDYNVVLPAGGFFLGLEYIVGADKFYPASYMVGYTPIGPILRPPYAFADTRTWAYILGKGWQRIPAAQTCWPLYESALSVEVEPAR